MVARARGFESRHLQERCSAWNRMQRCWGCLGELPVSGDDFSRPRDRVHSPDAGRLGSDPKFQIFGRVVIADPVLMVDAFVGKQRSTELLLHHDDVFEDVALGSGSRMVWHPNHEVPGVMLGPAALPIVVRWSGLASTQPASPARARLDLLGIPASALVSRSAGRAVVVAAGWPKFATARSARSHAKDDRAHSKAMSVASVTVEQTFLSSPRTSVFLAVSFADRRWA
jgi:hypothetical protein